MAGHVESASFPTALRGPRGTWLLCSVRSPWHRRHGCNSCAGSQTVQLSRYGRPITTSFVERLAVKFLAFKACPSHSSTNMKCPVVVGRRKGQTQTAKQSKFCPRGGRPARRSRHRHPAANPGVHASFRRRGAAGGATLAMYSGQGADMCGAASNEQRKVETTSVGLPC